MAPSLLGVSWHEPSSKKVINKSHNVNLVNCFEKYSCGLCGLTDRCPLSLGHESQATISRTLWMDRPYSTSCTLLSSRQTSGSLTVMSQIPWISPEHGE